MKLNKTIEIPAHIDLNAEKSRVMYQDLAYRDKSMNLDTIKVIQGDGTRLLNVTPTWHNVKVYIKKGNGRYPGNILTWSSIQAAVYSGQIRLYDSNLSEIISKGYAEGLRGEAVFGMPEAELGVESISKPIDEKEVDYDTEVEGKAPAKGRPAGRPNKTGPASLNDAAETEE